MGQVGQVASDVDKLLSSVFEDARLLLEASSKLGTLMSAPDLKLAIVLPTFGACDDGIKQAFRFANAQVQQPPPPPPPPPRPPLAFG